MLNLRKATSISILAATSLVAHFLLANIASAQGPYPSKPITLVISTPPGSGSDIIGRKIADSLAKEMGQPVIVENKGGAAGLVAAAYVARADPDGYTLVWNAPAAITTWPHIKQLTIDPTKDLRPVSLAVRYPIVWLANSKLKINNMKELIELDKKRQVEGNRLTTGNAGVGGQNHLGTLMLNSMAGTDLLPVPYKGEGPSITDLLGGQVDTVITSLTSAMPNLNNERLTLLALAGKERSRILPNLPTVAELGFPDYSIEGWGGIFAPSKTPDSIINLLSKAIVNVVNSEELTKFMISNGSEPVGSTPEEFEEVIKKESRRNKELVEKFKISAD